MEKSNFDKRLMVRCAQMFYEQEMSQVEISQKLGLSKSTVSRVLNRAKDAGIVQFMVVNPLENNYLSLENTLESTFGLNEVYIVEDQANTDQLKETLAYAAAKYLERIVKSHYTIGVTWGTTLSKLPKYIEVNRDYQVSVVPLTGGLGSAVAEIHPNQIANRLAQKFKTTPYLLHAPGLMNSLEKKETFIEESSIAEILNMYDHLDVILSGIGSPTLNTSTMLSSNYYSSEEMSELVRNGAVADVANLMLDAHGSGDPFENNQRVVGISLSQIKNTRYSIAVAGGLPKLEAIHAAIKGQYFNVLIIDHTTAEALINKARG